MHINRFLPLVSIILLLALLIRIFGFEIGMALKKQRYSEYSLLVWEISSVLGNDRAAGRVGLIYWIGDGVNKDFNKAKKYLHKGLKGGGDIRYLIYALADIDANYGNHLQAYMTFEKLCKDKFFGACERLEYESNQRGHIRPLTRL